MAKRITRAAAARKKAAQKKVRELVKKGHRLSGKTSSTYKEATRQKTMGSYTRGLGAGTGHAAEKVVKRATKKSKKSKKRK
jgi:hypothetical protein